MSAVWASGGQKLGGPGRMEQITEPARVFDPNHYLQKHSQCYWEHSESPLSPFTLG